MLHFGQLEINPLVAESCRNLRNGVSNSMIDAAGSLDLNFFNIGSKSKQDGGSDPKNV